MPDGKVKSGLPWNGPAMRESIIQKMSTDVDSKDNGQSALVNIEEGPVKKIIGFSTFPLISIYGFCRSLTFCLAGFILLVIPGSKIDHGREFILTNKEYFLYFL